MYNINSWVCHYVGDFFLQFDILLYVNSELNLVLDISALRKKEKKKKCSKYVQSPGYRKTLMLLLCHDVVAEAKGISGEKK